MAFKVEGEARFAFTNTPGQVPSPPDNGELKVQQADGALITRKSDGTTRVTDIRGIDDQLASGSLAAAFGRKADLVGGLVPIAQLPPGFGGGGGGPITASQITDASASGRSVLTGTPASARSALGLGTAAVLAVGTTAGTVAAGDDARLQANANAIKLGANIGPDVDWLNFKTHAETVSINVGGLPDDCFPGGNTVGCYNGILGAIDIKTPGQNNLSTFAAAVGGIVRSTMSNPSPCGIFGAAMGNTPDSVTAQIFPANFVVTNQRNLNPNSTTGIKRAEMYGIEIDMEVHPADDGTPMDGHARGIWITGNSRVQPTGEFTGVLIGPAGILRSPIVPWKKAFRSQLGAAQIAFEAGELTVSGACSSQPITMIGRNSAGQSKTNSLLTDQDGNSLLRLSGAAFVIQNEGASTGITLRADGRLQAINADITSSLSVGGNASVNGTLTASVVNAGSLALSSSGTVGGNLTVNATLTAGTTNTGTLNASSNAGVGGNLTVNGGLAANTVSGGTFFLGGVQVQLTASGGTIPSGFKALIVAA